MPTLKNHSKTKLLTLTWEMQQMVKALKDKRGLPTESMVFYTAVAEAFNEEFPMDDKPKHKKNGN